MSTNRNAIRALMIIFVITATIGTTQAAGKPRNLVPQGQIAKVEKPASLQFAKDYLNPAYSQRIGYSSGIWLPGTYSRSHGKLGGKRPGK